MDKTAIERRYLGAIEKIAIKIPEFNIAKGVKFSPTFSKGEDSIGNLMKQKANGSIKKTPSDYPLVEPKRVDPVSGASAGDLNKPLLSGSQSMRKEWTKEELGKYFSNKLQ